MGSFFSGCQSSQGDDDEILTNSDQSINVDEVLARLLESTNDPFNVTEEEYEEFVNQKE